MVNDMLNQAIEYHRMGMSVLPLKPDKHCYIKWKKYQTKKADEAEIKSWWSRWPDANTGIVTGEISGIDSIDIDSEEAYEAINDFFIPTNFVSPIYKTPDNGFQIWVKHRPGLPNAADTIKGVVRGVDVRTNGGYTVAPVSMCRYEKNGRQIVGRHKWLDGLNPRQVQVSDWPDMLFDTILQSCGNRGNGGIGGNKLEDQKLSENQSSLWAERFLGKIGTGIRDDTVFHISNYLIKGGMPKREAEQFMLMLNTYAFDPPLDEKEIIIKIKSALSREDARIKNVLADLREYMESVSGIFTANDFMRASGLPQTIRVQKTVSQGLSRLVKDGIIERHGGKNGTFKKIENDCEKIDFINCDYKPTKINLPLGLNELVEIYPGNIITVSGVSNMGKTAFMLDLVYRNMKAFDVTYFNSEMDAKELRKRLDDFRAVNSIREWTFESRSVVEDMEHHIKQGEGKINIIDYIELDKDHYLISGIIKKIHKKLNGAIAVIAMQKKPHTEVGVGGYGTIFKSRLALNIEQGICSIFKAKNWASRRNPNGLKRKFEIVDGWDLTGRGPWYRDDNLARRENGA